MFGETILSARVGAIHDPAALARALADTFPGAANRQLQLRVEGNVRVTELITALDAVAAATDLVLVYLDVGLPAEWDPYLGSDQAHVIADWRAHHIGAYDRDSWQQAHKAAHTPIVKLLNLVTSADPETTNSIRRGLSDLGSVEECYKKLLADDPRLAGNVVATFTIAPNGVVTKSEVSGEGEDCFDSFFEEMKFPPRKGAKGLDVVAKIRLSPNAVHAEVTSMTELGELDE